MGRQLLGITKYDKLSIKIPHLTFTVHCLFCDRLLSSNEAILANIPFLGLLVVNLEMDIFRYDSYYANVHLTTSCCALIRFENLYEDN